MNNQNLCRIAKLSTFHFSLSVRKAKVATFFLLLLPMLAFAQDPTLKVSSPRQVSVGQKFQVVFESNAEGKNFTAPSFEGFNVVGGPFQSSSSSFQMVNGSMSHSVSVTYTYALMAYQEGTFHIGPATLTVKGNKITSQPFDIAVGPDNGGGSASSGNGGSSSQGGQRSNTDDPQVSGKDLFLKVVPSKKSVYLGEQFVLTYKLYTKVPVSSLSISKAPSYPSAWTKDISNNDGGSLRQTSEYVNGIEYTVAEVQKVVLVPQRAGKFVIDPMSIECVAQIATQRSSQRSMDPFEAFFNDPFFGRGYTNVQKELSTGSLGIDVKSLPTDDKPASFAGAVGNYNFVTEIDKTELKANEAFTLTLTVSGTGNIELLQMPEPVFPPDFEVYDPKIVTNVETNSQGIGGTKKAEYLVIPRQAGDFTLAPVEFSYFDAASGKYVASQSSQYDIHVEKGEGGETENNIYANNQEGIKYLGSDIRHIHTGDARLKPAHSVFFATAPYFITLLVLLILFVVAVLLSKKRANDKKDTVGMRNKRATKEANKRLKNASKFLKDKDQDKFYTEMSAALWGYIADKCGIEQSKLSMDTVSEAMKAKNVPDDLVAEFVDTLNSCEFARFAPGDAEQKMEGLYHKGLDVITQAERKL